MFAGTGVMFLLASLFVFLPLIILSPSKFALTFSLGSGLILASLGALKGWRQMAGHMTAKERLPFTAGVLEGSGVRNALHFKLWEHNLVFGVVMIADAEARWGVESRSHALTTHPGCHPRLTQHTSGAWWGPSMLPWSCTATSFPSSSA